SAGVPPLPAWPWLGRAPLARPPRTCGASVRPLLPALTTQLFATQLLYALPRYILFCTDCVRPARMPQRPSPLHRLKCDALQPAYASNRTFFAACTPQQDSIMGWSGPGHLG